MVDNACLKSARCLTGIVSEPTVFERSHQLLRYTLNSSAVMWCVLSSFANLSISRHSSSERPTFNIFLRNFSSRMNRSWIPKKFFFLHFFLSEFATNYLVIPWLSSHNGARGVALSLKSNSESRGHPWCTGQISCSPPFRFARSARTCNRRCRRPSMIDILCTVLWVPYRVVHTIRCSQLHESFLLILG